LKTWPHGNHFLHRSRSRRDNGRQVRGDRAIVTWTKVNSNEHAHGQMGETLTHVGIAMDQADTYGTPKHLGDVRTGVWQLLT
jgi:hypothetical protein